MIVNFDILIDASGSMGYMNGVVNEENKYLLPDKSTRTDLVKQILINSIIPRLSFVNRINLSSFRNETKKDKNGKPIVIDNKLQEFPISNNYYQGYYDAVMINKIISRIINPEPGGTPLFWAISTIINEKGKDDFNIIVLSDGDANDRVQFDEEILKQIKDENKNCKVYFIGIDQDEKAQVKSKNLADKTNGFYVNLGIMSYDENVFDSLLFDFQTNITSTAIKENIKISQPKAKVIADATFINAPIVNKEPKVEIAKEDTTSTNPVIDNEIQDESKDIVKEEFNIQKQVEVNTQSLSLISNQLDSIVKEISFIRKGNTTGEDEFIANEDEVQNKETGNKSEKYLFDHLKSIWENTTWMNENGEQGRPYDFDIKTDGKIYYIECKGSTSSSKEFFLTKNEWLFYLANRENYRLYFVSEIYSQNPTIHRIEDLLKDMEEGKLIPCSNLNRKVKADRILFQITN